MYKSFMQITTLKAYDAFWQAAGFLLMCYCLVNTGMGFYAFYIMAGVQLLSVVYWRVILYGLPVMRSRSTLQWIFFVLAPVLLLMIGVAPGIFFILSIYMMMWIGPLLGISYFITTIIEIGFYKNLVHRDAI